MKKNLPLSAGYILKNEFMIPLGITGYKLSQEIDVAQITISQIINNKRKITPDVAIRLSKYFCNSAEFWLNLQDIYDLRIALKEKKEIYKKIKPFKYKKSIDVKKWFLRKII
ncbi:MAG: HigA family addiction module antidote protein [Bacteroidales bacterium]|nr:HigA family addiction module antidote protein [Bacteroidales bacterium]